MLTTSTLADLPIPLSAVVKIGLDKVEQLWTARNEWIAEADKDADAEYAKVREVYERRIADINRDFPDYDSLDTLQHSQYSRWYDSAAHAREESESRIESRRKVRQDVADRTFLLAIIAELSPA